MDFSAPASSHLHDLRNQPESFWLERGKKNFWQLFTSMAERVPAYGQILGKQSRQAAAIAKAEEWTKVPTTDKASYLRQFELTDLSWDGRLAESPRVIAATSGSTGEPFFFPRGQEQDEMYALLAELYLLNNFAIDRHSTLYINAFPLGIWIGGMFTYQAIVTVARKENYRLSIVNVGIDKQGVSKVVQKLGNQFDQIIIGAYPPFMKDIIDDGVAAGVDWSKYRVGFIYSAESFSEGFRQYVYDACGVPAEDYFTRSLNHYGTVDLGTMAHETPLTILVRKLAAETPALAEALFEQTERQPTLCQYIPELFYFEEIGEWLACSSYSGLPLCRYNLQDKGGLLGFDRLFGLCAEHGVDLRSELQRAGIESTVWQLPLVYVFERDDFSVNYYSFQLYPEAVKRGLQEVVGLGWLTGKFTMRVEHDSSFAQSLHIAVEKRPEQQFSLEQYEQISRMVVEGLMQSSSEFRKIRSDMGQAVDPVLTFYEYEDDQFFKPGAKQKWVQS